jgi:hypothetical protein
MALRVCVYRGYGHVAGFGATRTVTKPSTALARRCVRHSLLRTEAAQCPRAPAPALPTAVGGAPPAVPRLCPCAPVVPRLCPCAPSVPPQCPGCAPVSMQRPRSAPVLPQCPGCAPAPCAPAPPAAGGSAPGGRSVASCDQVAGCWLAASWLYVCREIPVGSCRSWVEAD